MSFLMYNKSDIFYFNCFSEKHKDNPFCGDHVSIEYFDNEGILVLVLSDGVGSYHYDYIASQTACESFLKSFSENNEDDITERFRKAVLFADNAVSNPMNDTHKGMMCTFVAVVWETSKNYFYYDSIGDSRLYKFNEDGLNQISEDNTKSVVRKNEKGDYYNTSGSIRSFLGLTNALGRNNVLTSVKQLAFLPGESIILCTDGLYKTGMFEEESIRLMSNVVDDSSLEKYRNERSVYFEDDASAIILQRNDSPEGYERILLSYMENNSNATVIPHLLLKYIQKQILESILHKNSEKAIFFANYIKRQGLVLQHVFCRNALSEMKRNGFMVSDLYYLLIRYTILSK